MASLPQVDQNYNSNNKCLLVRHFCLERTNIRKYYLSLEKRIKWSLNFKECEQEKQGRSYLPVVSNLLCGSASFTKLGTIWALSLFLPKRWCRLTVWSLLVGPTEWVRQVLSWRNAWERMKCLAFCTIPSEMAFCTTVMWACSLCCTKCSDDSRLWA